MSKIREALEAMGAKKIEGYVLINNYGYTFELDGVRYDARFWANCYGAYIGLWGVSPEHKEIEDALNKIGEE